MAAEVHGTLRTVDAEPARTPRSTPTGTSTTSSACRSGRPSRPRPGWPAPVVVAHEALPARFDRYIMTAGYNGIINRRQFDIDSLEWPTEYRYPDRTYRDHLDLEVGGVPGRAPPRPGGDRRPHLDLVPRRAGCCAAATCSSGPHPTPATRRRSSATRSSGPTPCAGCSPSTTRPAAGPEVLLPGHGYPVVGGRPGPPGPRRHRRAARVAGRPDARPHERRRPARRGDPHGARRRPT